MGATAEINSSMDPFQFKRKNSIFGTINEAHGRISQNGIIVPEDLKSSEGRRRIGHPQKDIYRFPQYVSSIGMNVI